MSSIFVDILIDDSAYNDVVDRILEQLGHVRFIMTPQVFAANLFLETYSEWFDQHSVTPVRVVANDIAFHWGQYCKYYRVRFDEENKACAILFKLTFGGGI